MFSKVSTFESVWKAHRDGTLRIFGALTDESLAQRVVPGGRTLGRIAWHITETLPEMMNRTGLHVDGPEIGSPVPTSAAEIRDAYEKASASVLEQVGSNWNDETLEIEDDMYGMRWTRAFTLGALVEHEAHHRGQMTVLMRQAGLRVPGVAGPAFEEWAEFGMSAPIE
jgi:uncharacterized damage-inducible protein DinB